VSAVAPAMMDGQAATHGEHPLGGRIRARRGLAADWR